jgi:5-(carboxyamino)imidazole ribonucleotide mutase
MLAAKTHLPVLGVPIKSSQLNGLDSLLSIVQMPGGYSRCHFCDWQPRCNQCGNICRSILSAKYPKIKESLLAYRQNQTQQILDNPHPK